MIRIRVLVSWRQLLRLLYHPSELLYCKGKLSQSIFDLFDLSMFLPLIVAALVAGVLFVAAVAAGAVALTVTHNSIDLETAPQFRKKLKKYFKLPCTHTIGEQITKIIYS